MKYLAHRGFWRHPSERNSTKALELALSQGYGLETDVRDYQGRLVISHDPPNHLNAGLETLLTLPAARSLPLALNIKADGLARDCREMIERFELQDAFVFDMSVPDMRAYFKEKLQVFTRLSEVEKEAVWLERSAGVWLDAFSDQWYDMSLIKNLLQTGKKVAIVSPELHGRPHQALWNQLTDFNAVSTLYLCTDYPADAEAFFGASA